MAQKQRLTAILPDVSRGHDHVIGMRFRFTHKQARRHLNHSGRFPAFNPGIRIDLRGFAHANVIIERRTGKVIRQRRAQRFNALVPPLRQISRGAIEPPALLSMGNVQRFIPL